MKRELKFFGLSYAQSQIGAYVAVLDEVRGSRRMAVIIRPGEAQVIASKMENIKTKRPTTHEVLKNLTDSFNMDIQEVVIYNQAEGIFYTRLVCSDGIDDNEIGCSVGDGIAFSLLYDCPLYVEESVLSEIGVEVDDEGNMIESSISEKIEEVEEKENTRLTNNISVLEKRMQEALAKEEYEEAAMLRDQIKDLKDGNS